MKIFFIGNKNFYDELKKSGRILPKIIWLVFKQIWVEPEAD